MKKFKSKNIVTLLGLTVLIVILFFFYKKRVNDAINPVSVPYAKKDIPAGIQITEEYIGTTDVPPSMLTDTVLRKEADVKDKYSNADTRIPAGSLFYERNVVEKEKLPANIILDYPKEGYVLYNLTVDIDSSYGNSIYPGNYIDLYLKARTKTIPGTNSTITGENKVVLGKIIENVQVITVKDAAGKPVFQDMNEDKEPAMVVFAVPEEYYILLKKAEYLRTYDSELIPVPTNESLKDEPGELKISSKSLKEWINSVTIWDLD